MLKQLEDGKPIILRDTISSQGRKITNALFVPLLSGGQLIGVIGLEQENSEYIWTEQDLTIAEAAANRAALTLENARLLEESQRRATKERAIFEATARIGSALNVENILHIAAEELERVLGDAEVIIQLQNESNG
jgi:GAF domain-containing protein